MAKKTKTSKIQARDWIIALLFLGICLSNYVWYLNRKALDTTDRNTATYQVNLQTQINTLHNCIDQSIKPCNFQSPNTQVFPNTKPY